MAAWEDSDTGRYFRLACGRRYRWLGHGIAWGMESKHVIVAGPDPHARTEIAEAFRALGYHVIPVENTSLAGEALAAADAEYLVLGLGFPRIDLDALRRAIDPAGSAEPESLDTVERRHIERVLQQTGGNRSRTARLLGISRSTLLSKIRRYGLP